MLTLNIRVILVLFPAVNQLHYINTFPRSIPDVLIELWFKIITILECVE